MCVDLDQLNAVHFLKNALIRMRRLFGPYAFKNAHFGPSAVFGYLDGGGLLRVGQHVCALTTCAAPLIGIDEGTGITHWSVSQGMRRESGASPSELMGAVPFLRRGLQDRSIFHVFFGKLRQPPFFPDVERFPFSGPQETCK